MLITRFVIPFMKESPRWLATKHKNELALKNLAWIRKTPIDDPDTQAEYAEIIAAVEEEEAVVDGRSWKEVFAKGNRIRFFIAFAIFTFQQVSRLTLARFQGLVADSVTVVRSELHQLL